MDSTESQLRFGASLSASQIAEVSTSGAKFLRHLEERALLTNYFNANNAAAAPGSSNSSGSSSSGASGGGIYYSTISGGGGPFVSSRFGSGIDARRKLTIMQHQHQQFANVNNGGGGNLPLAAHFASSQVIATRRDLMSYAVSLMRTYTNEHRDHMPSVDVSLLKHVAYVFDGVMFFLSESSQV